MARFYSRFRLTKRRIKRWLPFIGALTVFATFVIKDAIREQVKDLADSIELAEGFFIVSLQDSHLPLYMFAVHQHLDLLQDELDGIAHHRKAHTVTVAVSQGLSGLEPGATTVTKEEFLGTISDLERMRRERLDDFRMTRLRFAETGPAFEKISRLLDKLAGDNKDLHTRLSGLTQKTQDFNARCDRLENEASQPEHNYHELKKFESSAEQADDESKALLDESTELLQRVFLVAENQRTTMEHSYAVFSWCSYVLYTFGWGLGLLGHFLVTGGSYSDE